MGLRFHSPVLKDDRMFYKLHEKLLLRGWQKLPNAVVEQGVGRPVFITAREMVIN